MHFSPPTLDCLAAALGPLACLAAALGPLACLAAALGPLACLAAALAPQPGLPNLTLTHPPFKRICQYFFLFLTKRVVAGPYMTPWGSPDFFSYKFPSQVETQWRGIQSILNKNRGGGGQEPLPSTMYQHGNDWLSLSIQKFQKYIFSIPTQNSCYQIINSVK